MFELVTGGAASGKSEYAEGLLHRLKDGKYYIATMESDSTKSRERIIRHRRLRAGKGFETIECPCDIAKIKLPSEAKGVLVECITNLLANEMFAGERCGAGKRVITGIGALKNQVENLVVVTGEVGNDGKKYDEFTEEYINTLAKVNRVLAKEADRVTEVVVGIPVRFK